MPPAILASDAYQGTVPPLYVPPFLPLLPTSHPQRRTKMADRPRRERKQPERLTYSRAAEEVEHQASC